MVKVPGVMLQRVAEALRVAVLKLVYTEHTQTVIATTRLRWVRQFLDTGMHLPKDISSKTVRPFRERHIVSYLHLSEPPMELATDFQHLISQILGVGQQ